ncbi:MAG: hypothetical protein O9256_00525 [Rhizobiaceae bacterium]|nr:hypothetical protein [Rhizobiaceae bacterium]
MDASQKKQCHAIIHAHAVAAGAGNAVPVPGLGIATDMVAMTTMAMSLCAVFGGNIKEEAAKTLAIAAIKNTMLKQPIKVLAKELSKLVPGLGQVIAPSVTVVMLEAAGWVLANELDLAQRERAGKRSKPSTGTIAEIIQKTVAQSEAVASPVERGSKSVPRKAAKKTAKPVMKTGGKRPAVAKDGRA